MTITNTQRAVLFAGLIGAVLFCLCSCAPTVKLVPKAVSPADIETRLLDAAHSPLKVSNSLEIPFTLTRVPQETKLQFEFQVVTKGNRCPASYKPTTVQVNANNVGKLSFVKYMEGQSVITTVEVPSGALRSGENLINVSMGYCQYANDMMMLNSVTLLQ